MTQGTTYDQFTREAFEEWLNTIAMDWNPKPRTAGVYQLPLSSNVAIEVSSSLTGRDSVVNYAKASMQLRLVSLVTGQVLNKKAQGQSHFKRTKGWRDSLKAGVFRMRDAYRKSESFYEAIAEITDREAYQKELTEKIESVPGWQQNDFLADMFSRLVGGGVLTTKQKDAVLRVVDRPAPSAPAAPQVDEDFIQRLRGLYAAARRAGDQWLMEFAKSVAEQAKAGRRLSEKQIQTLERGFERHRVASDNARLFEEFYSRGPHVR